MTDAIDNARKALEWYDDDSEDGGGIVLGGMAVAEALRDLLDSLEYEYAVEDYRAPGYLPIGDVELSREDRERYYGTRPPIRRIKAGAWERVS